MLSYTSWQRVDSPAALLGVQIWRRAGAVPAEHAETMPPGILFMLRKEAGGAQLSRRGNCTCAIGDPGRTRLNSKEGNMSHTTAHAGMSSGIRNCIEACTSCSNVCTETMHHCLHMGGRHAGAEHVTTLLDCAEICRTSADFLLRTSPLRAATCSVCAAVCRACEESCRGLGGEEMKRCADECARCAESCERMAGMAS